MNYRDDIETGVVGKGGATELVVGYPRLWKVGIWIRYPQCPREMARATSGHQRVGMYQQIRNSAYRWTIGLLGPLECEGGAFFQKGVQIGKQSYGYGYAELW